MAESLVENPGMDETLEETWMVLLPSSCLAVVGLHDKSWMSYWMPGPGL